MSLLTFKYAYWIVIIIIEKKIVGLHDINKYIYIVASFLVVVFFLFLFSVLFSLAYYTHSTISIAFRKSLKLSLQLHTLTFNYLLISPSFSLFLYARYARIRIRISLAYFTCGDRQKKRNSSDLSICCCCCCWWWDDVVASH